jgi:Cdc6-like AAA superfamily ATPase
MGFFTDDLDSTVFRNRDALKDAYVPDEVVGRKNVMVNLQTIYSSMDRQALGKLLYLGM